MSQWSSTKTRQVLAALQRIGWTIKRQTGSHIVLEREGDENYVFAFRESFSPVAGISSCEREVVAEVFAEVSPVSVPLPGLVRAKAVLLLRWATVWKCFSPVAGISSCESPTPSITPTPQSCFSPVAGISSCESQGGERYRTVTVLFQSRCRD